MSLGTTVPIPGTTPQSVSTIGRTKPRMSTHERKLLKKKSSSVTAPMASDPVQGGTTPIVAPELSISSPISQTTGMRVHNAFVAGIAESNPISLESPSSSGLEVGLSRQLSDASNHLAQRAVIALQENGTKIQKVLLNVAHAHRNGIISVRQKAELKDILLTNGSKAVLDKLGTYPGATSFLKKKKSTDGGTHTESKPVATASRYHVFRGFGCYSVTMFVNEALRLEMALINGNEHCAVNSAFVALNPSLVPNELHEGTKQVLHEPNAGGKSFNSEALSFETLQALFGANHLITEMNVRYTRSHTSIVDFVCDILGRRVGVSVTRAMHFLGEAMFTPVHARVLLEKKLGGLDRASQAVCEAHGFDRQILHVWAQSERVGRLVRDAFESIPRPPESNPTVCLITVTDRLERFVFHNDPDMESKAKRDPLGFERLKKDLKKREQTVVSRLIQDETVRRKTVETAIRRVFSKDFDQLSQLARDNVS